MKIQQNHMVKVHLVPPGIQAENHLSKFSLSSPIYQNYHKKYENFQDHGKSDIWVCV